MSDKNKIIVVENPNEWVNWIEEVISKNHIKYYEYKNFYNIEKIGYNNFGEVYRTNLKNSEQYFVLKSFNHDNAAIVKEIIHEVIKKNAKI